MNLQTKPMHMEFELYWSVSFCYVVKSLGCCWAILNDVYSTLLKPGKLKG